MAKQVRRDKKNRILNSGEYQKANGMYEYRYTDAEGGKHSVYSWMLTAADKPPKGKSSEMCLRDMIKQIDRDKHDAINSKKARTETLDDYFDKRMKSNTKMKDSTRVNYNYMYGKYVQPVFGTRKIATIKHSEVLDFYNSLILEQGFKPRSMEIIQTILNPVFSLAVDDGIIRISPTQNIMKKVRNNHDWTKPEVPPLEIEEQTAFIDYVKNSKQYNHWLPLFTFLLGTGCRVSEACGLRWEDCYFEDGYIDINHNLIYRPQEDGKCAYRITTTKTKSGNRLIPMLDEVRKALLQEKKRQMKEGFCTDIIDGYSNFVFTNRNCGVYNAHCINRAIDRITKEYNAAETQKAKEEKRQPLLLPHFTVHQLRHTFCTRFCENETNLKVIQKIMGHANIETTMDVYNKATQKKKVESFAALEGKIKIS